MNEQDPGIHVKRIAFMFVPFFLTGLVMLYRPVVNQLAPQWAPLSAVGTNLASAGIFYLFALSYCERFNAPRGEILYSAACSLLYVVLVAVSFGCFNWHGVLFWVWLWPTPALCGTVIAYLKTY